MDCAAFFRLFSPKRRFLHTNPRCVDATTKAAVAWASPQPASRSQPAHASERACSRASVVRPRAASGSAAAWPCQSRRSSLRSLPPVQVLQWRRSACHARLTRWRFQHRDRNVCNSVADGLFEVCQLVERRLQLLRPLSLDIVERLLLCSSCILPRAFSSSNWRTCRAELTRVCSVALLVKIERQACSDLFGRCRLHGGRRARCPASLGPRSRARRARYRVH